MNGKDLITVVEYLNKGHSKMKKSKAVSKTSLLDRIKEIDEEKKLYEAYLKEMNDKKQPSGIKLTFAEGMLMAFLLQWFVFPIVTVYLKMHGLL